MRQSALVTFALIGVLALPAAGLAACPRTSLADLEDEVMCPVCGTPLALATEAPQGQRQREFILRLVDRCRSKEQIKAALVAEFGPSVLAVPDTGGFDLAAYLVPILAGIVVSALLALAIVRWRRAAGRDVEEPDLDEPPPNVVGADCDRLEAEEQASVEDERRLETDLRRYDL